MFQFCLFSHRNLQRTKSRCVLLETRSTSEMSTQREAVWAVCMERSWPRCVTVTYKWCKKCVCVKMPGPPGCPNKLSDLRYVNPSLAGIWSHVLWNQCQRGNQCGGGCASSSEVGGWSFRCFSFRNHENPQICFFFSFHREVKKNVKLKPESDSQVRLSPSNTKKTFNTCCGL